MAAEKIVPFLAGGNGQTRIVREHTRKLRAHSMMLVITETFYVIPGSCLVATIALINLNALATGVALACRSNLLGNHFKVHHVMAWWGLMTLSAIG